MQLGDKSMQEPVTKTRKTSVRKSMKLNKKKRKLSESEHLYHNSSYFWLQLYNVYNKDYGSLCEIGQAQKYQKRFSGSYKFTVY